jgi:hypothetical protein
MATAEKFYDTQTQLAKAIGITQQVLSGHLRRVDCPLPQMPPWSERHVEIYNAWREMLREEKVDENAIRSVAQAHKTHREIEVKLKMQRMLKVKLEREILEKLYINREEVETGWVSRANHFRQSLERLPAAVAPALVGLSAADIEHELQVRLTEIVDNYSRRPRPGLDTAA